MSWPSFCRPWVSRIYRKSADEPQPVADGISVDMNGCDTQEAYMSHLKEAVLARAAKPSKAVAKVVAVRIKTDNYAILAQAAKDEGVKVGELVRAAIDELCEQLAAKE